MKYLPFLFIIFLFSCNNDDILIEPVDLQEWKDEIPKISGIARMTLNSAIQFDRLYVHGVYILYKSNEENEIESAIVTGSQTNIYTKNAFSKDLYAYSNLHNTHISIKLQQESNSPYDDIWLPNSRDTTLNFEQVNIGKEIGAFNDDNFFLTSVKQDEFPNEIKLFILKIETIEYGIKRDKINYNEPIITLPTESTTEINRVQSFGNYFYVSTLENAYRVDTNGNVYLLFNHTINDFFEFDGKLYADDGNKVYQSSDNGQSWNLVADNLNYDGFRQFFTVNDNLYCYDNDQLYKVNPNDFSITNISNRNLEGKTITSAIVFDNKVWLTTLDGIFTRKVENF